VLIKEHFDNDEGHKLISRKLKEFGGIIEKLCEIYQVTQFVHQTAQSLTEIYLLTLALKPSTILEIGCGSRSSSLALASAGAELDSDVLLYGVDIAPTPFDKFTEAYFPGMSFCNVIDIKIDATEFEIPDEWERPLLTFYDAHDDDLPGSIVSAHAISNWFPCLSGQVVSVHDFSVFPADSPATPGDIHSMESHFSNRKIIGFKEVVPLVSWMNELKVDFTRPGDELGEMGFQGGDSSLIYFTAP